MTYRKAVCIRPPFLVFLGVVVGLKLFCFDLGIALSPVVGFNNGFRLLALSNLFQISYLCINWHTRLT